MGLPIQAFLSAVAASMALTPLVRWLAIRYRVTAAPNHRTIHSGNTPKLGGLSILVAAWIGVVVLGELALDSRVVQGVMVGASLLAVLGLFDDIFVLNCYIKLAVQALAAILAMTFGLSIESLILPSGSVVMLHAWSLPVTVFWIVAVTNAVNLIDGLDGLASGFSVLVLALVAGLGMLSGDHITTNFAFVLLAANVGFLMYNWPPARIFMGDTGSLFLGFSLACLSIKGASFQLVGVHWGLMTLPFAVPLTDTLLAVTRRLTYGQHPFQADKQHIHHRLLESGVTQLVACIVMFMATVLFCLCALATLFLERSQGVLILTIVIAIFVFGLFRINCFSPFIGGTPIRDPVPLRMDQKAK